MGYTTQDTVNCPHCGHRYDVDMMHEDTIYDQWECTDCNKEFFVGDIQYNEGINTTWHTKFYITKKGE